MKTMSLRARLTLFYSAILTVILGVFGFLFYDALGLVLESKLTAELRGRVFFLTAFQRLQAGEARLVFNANDRKEAYLVQSAARYYQVFQLPSGVLLVQSQELEMMGTRISPDEVRALAGAP